MTRAIEIKEESRTELDSHANMPVVGKHAYIIAESSKMVDVSLFTPDYKPLTVPLVDAMIKYNNPYNGKSCILVLRNALYVPSMNNNLIPPFMLREMGVAVNDVPKIHKEDPTVDDHAPPSDGHIAASIGSTNTLQSQYISDSEPEAEEQDHDDSTCNDDDDSFVITFDLDDEGAHERVDEFFSHSMSASRP